MPRVVELLMLGIGTVFSTLGLVLLVLPLDGWGSSGKLPSLQDFGTWLPLYGMVGAVIASVICLVGAIPLVILFRLIFSLLRKRGIGLRMSAMITSGGLALVVTLVVLVAATVRGAIFLPPFAWPIAVVPSIFAVVFSTLLSFDSEFGK